MQIKTIFASRLYAVQYPGFAENELARVLRQWQDAEFVFQFLESNLSDLLPSSREGIAEDIFAVAEEWDDFFYGYEMSGKDLDLFFQPLDDLESGETVLSKRKAKKRHSYPRLYALKIEPGVYIVTGGAIKVVHKMKDQEETKQQLIMLEKCREFLRENGVIDDGAFCEFLLEQD